MKNSLAMAFVVIAFVAGAVIAAGLYFSLVFGVLGALGGTAINDRTASALGNAVAIVAGPVGVCVGVALALDFGWTRFKRDDLSPDWAARIVGLVLGVPLVLTWLLVHGLPALDVIISNKAPGFLALAGFLAAGGWVHKALTPKD